MTDIAPTGVSRRRALPPGWNLALSAAALVGVSVAAALLLYGEQISLASILVGALSVALLAYSWGVDRRGPTALVTVDLAILFLYAWSLGAPSGLSIVVRTTATGFAATVDGNTFYQPGHARRIGLYSAAATDYNVLSNDGRIVTGDSPLSWLANATRFAPPRSAWTGVSVATGGRETAISAGRITPLRGAWSANRRGEIEGSPGAVGWLAATGGRSFRFSGTLMRPDGIQGVVLDNGPGRTGFLLAIRMDHRDARFYYWNHGRVGGCTCHRPQTFPVKVEPMVQRLLRFLLPSLLLAMGLMMLAWLSIVIAGAIIPPGLSPSGGGGRPTRPRSRAHHLGSRLPVFRRWGIVVGLGTGGGPTTGAPSPRASGPPALPFDVLGIVLAAVGTASAALIALNVNQTLPTIEDTATYIFEAKTLALGRLWAPVPPKIVYDLVSLPFTVVFHGHWFGKYPPGWPLLLAVGALFDKAWMVTPLVGGVSLLLVYLIGRELYSPVVGLVAAVLALSSPFFLSMSGSLLSQSATWMWCGLFVYLLIRWFKRLPPGMEGGGADPTEIAPPNSMSPGSGGLGPLLAPFAAGWRAVGRPAAVWRTVKKLPEQWYLLVGAGAAIGAGFATRQLDALTLALPFGVLLFRRPLGVVFAAGGAALPIGLLALYNQALTGNPTGSGYTAAASYDRLGFGAGVGGPTAYERGFDLARGVWNVAYDLEHLQMGLFGWPFYFGLALVAIPFVTGRFRRWDWLLLASSLFVVAAYGAYWASGVTGGLPRYWYAIVPWLAILAARGLEEMVAWPAKAGFGAPAENTSSALAATDAAGVARGRRAVAPPSSPVSQLAAPVGDGSSDRSTGRWPLSDRGSGRSWRTRLALPVPALVVAIMMYFDVHTFLPANVLSYRNPGGAVVAAVGRSGIHHAVIFQHQNTPQSSEYDITFSRNSPLLDGDIIWALDKGPARDRRAMAAFPGRRAYLLDFLKLRPLSR